MLSDLLPKIDDAVRCMKVKQNEKPQCNLPTIKANFPISRLPTCQHGLGLIAPPMM